MTQRSVPPRPARQQSTGVGTATLYLPPLRHKLHSRGFGAKMGPRTTTQTTIYRSVPPRPLSYTFTDILDSYPNHGKSRSKTAPVSSNAPEEYAQRFKSRPTTRPKVIEFDGNSFSLESKRRGVTGFSPSVKLRVVPGTARTKTVELPELQLAPSRSTNSRQKLPSGRQSSRAARSGKSRKSNNRPRTKSSASVKSENRIGKPEVKTPITSEEGPVRFNDKLSLSNHVNERLPEYVENPVIYPNILATATEYEDLTYLPRPKKILPRKDAPWVYRFKVKKNMNALTKIMASKPCETPAQTSQGT